jgi:hypothetical protein
VEPLPLAYMRLTLKNCLLRVAYTDRVPQLASRSDVREAARRPCYGPTAGDGDRPGMWRRVASGNGRRRNSSRSEANGPARGTATHAAAGDDRGGERGGVDDSARRVTDLSNKAMK